VVSSGEGRYAKEGVGGFRRGGDIEEVMWLSPPTGIPFRRKKGGCVSMGFDKELKLDSRPRRKKDKGGKKKLCIGGREGNHL